MLTVPTEWLYQMFVIFVASFGGFQIPMRWLYKDDIHWVLQLMREAPMLKFVGAHANVLDRQPPSNLMREGTCMHFLLSQGLSYEAEVDMAETSTSIHFEAVDWALDL